ncbi:thioredoxin-like protein [Lipomyces arxii]|uniref:thioredoxin-like protein n=1 Tax=Lipomyces arxii TaxID=56418 RepID=UPI0034CD618C
MSGKMAIKSLLFLVQILLLVLPSYAGFYDKGTEVINLTPKTFNKEVAQTNYTTIVEFYAEWCGHCKNLRPQYVKAAQNLNGIAKVAAVRCDDKANEPLCSKYQVKGYPTLKIFRPNPKTPGKPMMENYQGERKAKSIVDTVLGRIANRVKRLRAIDLDSWFQETDLPYVLLFTNKAATPPMYKTLAIDFASTANFGIIKNSEKVAVEKYKVSKYPTLIVFHFDNGEWIKEQYGGSQKKEALYEFVGRFAMPVEGPDAGKVPMHASKLIHEEL